MLLLISVVPFLVAHVCLHCRFIKTYRTHTVTSCPKVIPGKIFFSSKVMFMDKNSRFSFQTSYHLCHSISWGDTQTHMDMIGHRMPFNQFYAKLIAQFSKYTSYLCSKSSKYHFFTIFWDKDDVIRQYHITWDCLFHSCIGSFLGIHSVGMLWFESFYRPTSTPGRLNLVGSHRQRWWFNRSAIN